jgi:hypothetical protein
MKTFSSISFLLSMILMKASTSVFAQSDSGGATIWIRADLPPTYNNTDANVDEIEIPVAAMTTLEAYGEVAAAEYEAEIGFDRTRRLRGSNDFLRKLMIQRELSCAYGAISCTKCRTLYGQVLCQIHDCCPARRQLDNGSDTVPIEVVTTNPLANMTCLQVREEKVEDDIQEANIVYAAGFEPAVAHPEILFCIDN